MVSRGRRSAAILMVVSVLSSGPGQPHPVWDVSRRRTAIRSAEESAIRLVFSVRIVLKPRRAARQPEALTPRIGSRPLRHRWAARRDDTISPRL